MRTQRMSRRYGVFGKKRGSTPYTLLSTLKNDRLKNVTSARLEWQIGVRHEKERFPKGMKEMSLKVP